MHHARSTPTSELLVATVYVLDFLENHEPRRLIPRVLDAQCLRKKSFDRESRFNFRVILYQMTEDVYRALGI